MFSPRGVCDIKPIDGKIMQMAFWESDQPIVVKKRSNVRGAKGLAGMRWDEVDTSSRHRTGQRKSTKLSSLTQGARGNPKCKFISLAHLLDVDFLKACFRELKRGKAPGIDGVSVGEYEANLEENLKDLVNRLKSKRYRPQPVKRAYIPKPSGGERSLGIPAVEDKVVQMGIKKILEAIFEVDFLDISYGFRPSRSCHNALDVLDRAIMTKPVNWIVDMDIEKFFDRVDHEWLMRCLKQRIADSSLLRLIARFLSCGVMEEGRYVRIDKGTPQGGVLSPMLANIYLHFVLDLWFEKVVKKRVRGFVQMVRYADDFIVCFQYEEDAREFERWLKERLCKFGLQLSGEKSRIIEFGRCVWLKTKKVNTFDFLGFTHYCGKSRSGKFKLGRKTARDRFRRGLSMINEWLKRVRNLMEMKEWWKILRCKMMGHYRYYGIAGNMRSLNRYYWRVKRLAYKWINRRSQKKGYSWERFCRFLEFNPLPKPRIYHGYSG